MSDLRGLRPDTPERLRHLAAAIEAEPAKFDMESFLEIDWGYAQNFPGDGSYVALFKAGAFESCGTGGTACIAGWAMHLWRDEIGDEDASSCSPAELGAIILGLDAATAWDLFLSDHAMTYNPAGAAARLREMADEIEAGRRA